MKYAPASSKFKIYIIDEVHMLTKEAFNALLKTLEEPPAHVKFMFATTEPEKVLPTILSRCQRFDLRRIPIKLIVDHLRHIAKQENVTIDDAALHAIARGADGGMRDAESALDQLISFCGEKIVEADVLSMFGLTSQSQLLSLTDGLLKGDVQIVLTEFNELARHGKDLGKFLADLLQHLRNLLVFQISKGDTRLLEVSEAEAGTLSTQAALANSDGLTRVMEDAHADRNRSARRRVETNFHRGRAHQSHRGAQRGEHRFSAETAERVARRSPGWQQVPRRQLRQWRARLRPLPRRKLRLPPHPWRKRRSSRPPGQQPIAMSIYNRSGQNWWKPSAAPVHSRAAISSKRIRCLSRKTFSPSASIRSSPITSAWWTT